MKREVVENNINLLNVAEDYLDNKDYPGEEIILDDVPLVEKQSKKEREKKRTEYEMALIKLGYKKAGIDEVMTKYRIEKYEDIEDIIDYSAMWMDYGDDYEDGCCRLLQDMYDCPAIFYMCVDYAERYMAKFGMKRNWDELYNYTFELSRMPCENLKYIYDVTPTVYAETKDESMRFFINDVPIEEKKMSDNPGEIHCAIDRARDKYLMINEANNAKA